VTRRFSVIPPRPQARLAAAVCAAAAFALAVYTSAVESMPELHIYDGYWMLLGAALAVGVTAPLVWRQRRERSLPIVVGAAIVGSWAPLVIFALRQHMSVIQRLRGARVLMGADVVGAAIGVGVACLWLALREPGKR
jgi:RsiW-degrading membrane proteinase PrsW (M82 family)